MKVFTDSEAREDLPSVLEQAARDGGARIQRRDGQTFVVKPERRTSSPLAIKGLDLGMTREEIVSFVREGRDRPE